MTTPGHPPARRSWSCPLVLAEFAAIEGEVAGFLAAAGVEGRPAFVAQLVVEETVRNLAEHSPGAGPQARAEIRLSVGAHDVVVEVDDTQEAFDPWTGPALDPAAPLEQRRPGGMGLHLLRDLTDELRYERTPDGNRLTARVTRATR